MCSAQTTISEAELKKIELALNECMVLKAREPCQCPPQIVEPAKTEIPWKPYLTGGAIGLVVGALVMGLTVAVVRD